MLKCSLILYDINAKKGITISTLKIYNLNKEIHFVLTYIMHLGVSEFFITLLQQLHLVYKTSLIQTAVDLCKQLWKVGL